MGASLNQRLGWVSENEARIPVADQAKFINSICSAEYDFSEVMQAIERMKPSKLKSAFKKVFRQAASKMRNPVREQIKSEFPGNREDPRNKNRKHGVLRGKPYGPLYKDLRMMVYKNGFGANVNMYTPSGRYGRAGRQNVMRWLNDGTRERFSERTHYSNWRKNYAFLRYGGGYDRGALMGAKFWDTIYSHTEEAQQYVGDNIARLIVQAYNKQIQTDKT